MGGQIWVSAQFAIARVDRDRPLPGVKQTFVEALAPAKRPHAQAARRLLLEQLPPPRLAQPIPLSIRSRRPALLESQQLDSSAEKIKDAVRGTDTSISR